MIQGLPAVAELVAQTPKIKPANTGRMPRPPQRRRQLQCTKRNRPIAAWSLGASYELSVPPLHRYRQVRHQSLCSMSSHHLIARCSPFASSDIQARMAQLLRGCPLRRYGWGWPRTGCGAPRNRSPRSSERQAGDWAHCVLHRRRRRTVAAVATSPAPSWGTPARQEEARRLYSESIREAVCGPAAA